MKVTGLKLLTEPFYCFCENYRVVEKLLNRHEFVRTVYPVIRVGMFNAEGDTALDPVYISSSADSYTFAFLPVCSSYTSRSVFTRKLSGEA